MSLKTNQSIEQLENKFWGEPNFESSLVINCHKLRKVPIQELTAEDLRLLIGQGIGLPYIIPLALERLVDNPLCGGDMFNGDLLCNVLRISESFWLENTDMFYELLYIMNEVEKAVELYQSELKPKWDKIKDSKSVIK